MSAIVFGCLILAEVRSLRGDVLSAYTFRGLAILATAAWAWTARDQLLAP